MAASARRLRAVGSALAPRPTPAAGGPRLASKVCAVTGGASGIGEAAVRLFVEEGATVGFADRDAERGEAIAAELRAAGAQVLFVAAQTGIEADCANFIAKTVEAFGRLDVLVNNAGVRSYLKVTEATEESWDEIWGVNVKGCARSPQPQPPTPTSHPKPTQADRLWVLQMPSARRRRSPT